jgi:hypothetical protein
MDMLKKFWDKYRNYVLVDGVMYLVMILVIIIGIVVVKIFFIGK